MTYFIGHSLPFIRSLRSKYPTILCGMMFILFPLRLKLIVDSSKYTFIFFVITTHRILANIKSKRFINTELFVVCANRENLLYWKLAKCSKEIYCFYNIIWSKIVRYVCWVGFTMLLYNNFIPILFEHFESAITSEPDIKNNNRFFYVCGYIIYAVPSIKAK